MVAIKPFEAIRYDAEAVGELSRVLAPPYDVITPARQDELYAQHEANIVRVDLNKAEAGDEELSRYERAQATLHGWLEQGLLKPDPSPAFYVLAQTFVGPDGVERTRTGFFGRARLTKFGEGPIMPHERTLKGPKLDRLRLFRATRTNLSPIFGMYSDAHGEVLAVLEAATKRAPDAEAEMDGTKNRLWRLDDPGQIATIEDALAPKKLYIADGHHRYETGLAYRDERRRDVEAPDPEAGYESILMFSAAVEDPGMVVFPTHRLVHSVDGFDETQVVLELGRYFDITDAPGELDAAMAALASAGEQGRALLMVTRGARRLLTLKAEAPLSKVPTLPKHPSTRKLDCNLLHSVVLEHILGISREAQATQQNLRYSKDNAEAFTACQDDPSVQIAFLMNPTKISEVIDVSEAGEVMPQKSTFFYPKIPSGLVLYPLD